MAESSGHVCVKKAVKEMFAGLAADGEASGDVGARAEAALHGIADRFVFILNFFADFYAGSVFLCGFRADVGEVVVEDDGAFVDCERKNEIGVHDAFVCVDHEIWIDPEIERTALAGGGDVFFGFGAGSERAGLKARALEVFDGVAGVLDDARETFVGVRNVVAAVEIIVDVDLPVALEGVNAAVEKFEFLGELKRCDEFGNFAEKAVKRSGFAVEIDEDEILPSVERDGDETVFGAIEIADAFKFDHALECAVIAIGPAVIGAAEILGAALRFGDNGGGVMAADVVKGTKHTVIAARDDDGLARKIGGEEIAFVRELIDASGNLPSCGENGFLFEAGDAGIEIPGRRNGPGFFERVVGIVEVEQGRETTFHSGSLRAGFAWPLCIAKRREEARKRRTGRRSASRRRRSPVGREGGYTRVLQCRVRKLQKGKEL
jgi:hypothetical protein